MRIERARRVRQLWIAVAASAAIGVAALPDLTYADDELSVSRAMACTEECADAEAGQPGTGALPRTGDQAASGVVLAVVALVLGTTMAFSVKRPRQS